MLALVLGGNGFIGSHVVDRLVSEGHSVRVYDRSSVEGTEFGHSKVSYCQGNFDDHERLNEALDSVDVVFHLISTSVPSTSNLDPVSDIQSNLVNTVKLLKVMEAHSVQKIVYLSSGGTVYGVPEQSPIPEEHPLSPICSYGIVKVAIENYLHMYSRLNGLDYVALRASNPFGPRQGNSGIQGVVGTFLWKAANHQPIDIYGDGSVVRDFLHVTDLAKLCVSAANSSNVGSYNAGSGCGHSISDVVDTISRVTGAALEVKYHEGRAFDVPHCVLDISKARRVFNWSPTIEFEHGVVDTWNWINKQESACNCAGIENSSCIA
ncbi:NAD-dependent epimerase/dehydratase family protein [Granulosicoccus sp. 3-233]|uniref:NAD-dependent epimerase/dehydratase family protein n=1 Tax=Granulosicoccus sp. 3-233 TaxID=3417969 RepID=UPI003D356692